MDARCRSVRIGLLHFPAASISSTIQYKLALVYFVFQFSDACLFLLYSASFLQNFAEKVAKKNVSKTTCFVLNGMWNFISLNAVYCGLSIFSEVCRCAFTIDVMETNW